MGPRFRLIQVVFHWMFPRFGYRSRVREATRQVFCDSGGTNITAGRRLSTVWVFLALGVSVDVQGAPVTGQKFGKLASGTAPCSTGVVRGFEVSNGFLLAEPPEFAPEE